ncbi:MAG TPA: 16S rRNA (adenine(1518)-N(6)/adenine(1519)-N(6))-dimethyltransferase RsmA [Bdellovibrionota bacterium]|nr:16S rRNA (adenine(1518)-N(6)/adenine(1519)-N(6))-dimethyltransferase RsmA [Bdellovibrionota bacterium]
MISPQRYFRESGFRAKKSLGQNFLIHAETVKKIADWADLREGETLLEIGPGLGALTEVLLARGFLVVAIERDRQLYAFLQTHFKERPCLRLLHDHALKINYADLFSHESPAHIVANLPYSISTPILERWIESRELFPRIHLLLQEEIVERIIAPVNSSDYGRLSIFVQTYYESHRGPKIPRGSFFPEPDVESRLVSLVRRDPPLVQDEIAGAFDDLVRRIFRHRRKTLRNSLRSRSLSPAQIEEILRSLNLNAQSRPETVSIQDLVRLMRALKGES